MASELNMIIRKPLRSPNLQGSQPDVMRLVAALNRLDALLQRAIHAFQQRYGAGLENDLFRGLHISDSDVERLLVAVPGSPLVDSAPPASPDDRPAGMDWLKLEYGLSDFDLDVLLVTLAPEIDLRYERLYAYLQDDVTRRRPTVDLALNLLCTNGEEKLARRSHFQPDAPLLAGNLIHLENDPDRPQGQLLSQFIALDGQVARLMLGEKGLDWRLANFCQLLEPDDFRQVLPLDESAWQGLKNLAKKAWFAHQPLCLYFQNPAGAGGRELAETLAMNCGALFLRADLSRIPASGEALIPVLVREARLKKAFLYLEDLDAVSQPEAAGLRSALFEALRSEIGISILTGSLTWQPDSSHPAGVLVVSLVVPAYEQRRVCWQSSLSAQGIAADVGTLDALASRFRLNPGQISEAAAVARLQSGLFPISHKRLVHLPRAILFRAARSQSGHQLAALAQKIEPRYRFDDIILPEDALTQLHEICQRVEHRGRVMDEWGFDRKLSLGKGVTALFAGPSGTGKTMSAEIIANELGLDLYKIDLSSVVSKYIGETEKNLNRIFEAAENANAILFFDEADALFGKRSEVHDSHDRYANIEISYLLQKMDLFEGIAILATNLMQNLDDAFIRRLTFTVYFPFPDEESRRRIWQSIWPKEVPLDGGISFDALARRFKLSGGSIKNIAVGAAFQAAGNDGKVRMEHLLHAARREYQKIGKVMPEGEAEA